jgi:D-alanyl-D-alanine carboxypeptidase (penicillin-binding protein 5/6)
MADMPARQNLFVSCRKYGIFEPFFAGQQRIYHYQEEVPLKYRHSIVIIALIILLFPVAPASALPQNRIPAKAAVVMDSTGAVLYAKYPDAKLAPASTVKLVTAMVVIDMLPPETKVKISRNAGKVRSIQPRLHPDEELTVSDLLHLALMKSINSAAVALAEAATGTEQEFVTLMNKKAREIGAQNTLYANASGLPKGVQYTTASDLALIMKTALTYPLIKEILGTKAWLVRTTEGRDIFFENSNDLLWRNDNMIGGKTGYTGNARHCFVSAINTDKGPLYTAVLGARSRYSLWRSTVLLEEIGMNPEMVSASERASMLRRVSHKVVQ